VIKAQVSLIGWCYQGFFAIVIAIFSDRLVFAIGFYRQLKIVMDSQNFSIIQFSSFDYE